MEKITRSKREWMFWIILAVPFIYSAIIWKSLPDRVPTHFDLHGNPNDYSSKLFGAFGLPGFAVIMYLILRYIPMIDPRRKNYDYFSNSYINIRFAIAVFMLLIYFFTVEAARSNAFLFHPRYIFTAVFLLFALIGNYMKNIRPNFFIGVRTPWTLDNADVWRKTHELGGKLWFYSGLAGSIACLFLPDNIAIIFFFGIMIPIAIVPVVYSYLEFRKIKKQENNS